MLIWIILKRVVWHHCIKKACLLKRLCFSFQLRVFLEEHCVELKRVLRSIRLVYKVQSICYKTSCFRRGIQICLLPESPQIPASPPGRAVKTQVVPEQIGPLQLAIHVVQNRRAGEQTSHWDKTNRENYHLQLYMLLCMSFVCLVPVRLLLFSVAVCTTWRASCKGPIQGTGYARCRVTHFLAYW